MKILVRAILTLWLIDIACADSQGGADSEWKLVERLILAGDMDVLGTPNTQFLGAVAWVDLTNRVMREQGRDFYYKYETDERRWIWLCAITSRSRICDGFRRNLTDGTLQVAFDSISDAEAYGNAYNTEAERTEWVKESMRMAEQCLSARNCSESQQRKICRSVIDMASSHLASMGRNSGCLDESILKDLIHLVFVSVTKFPGDETFAGPVEAIVRLVERWDPSRYRDLLYGLKATRHERLNALIAGMEELAFHEQQPLELVFTALDGRIVDVAQLRGKFVLLEFWASWCVPCLRELPRVRAIWDKYRRLGFEVIGVSIDRESDRERVRDLIEKMDIPWPQYFSGGRKGLADKFGITGIPRGILLNREGRVVSTRARNQELEALLKRELGDP